MKTLIKFWHFSAIKIAGLIVFGLGAIMVLHFISISVFAQADTTPPQVTSTGGPADGEVGVPIDAFVDRVFNESLAAASVSSTTVLLQANTGNTATGTPAGTNLCADILLENNNRVVCNQMADNTPLDTETWYTFILTTGIQDLAGNPLAATTTYTFRTGAFDFNNNQTPPFVVKSNPNPGAFGVARNATLTVQFPEDESGNMSTSGAGSITSTDNVLLQAESNGAPTGANLCASGGCSLTWNSTQRQLSINPASNLAANTGYILTIKKTATNANGVALNGGNSDYLVFFTTGSGLDTTGPSVVSTFPTTITSGTTSDTVSPDLFDLTVQFSEGLDLTTVNTSTILLFKDNGAGGGTANNFTQDGSEPALPTGDFNLRYASHEEAIHINFGPLLAVNTRYCVSLGSGIKDTNGNPMTAAVHCFQTGSSVSDSSPPTVLFADADNFGMWVEFSEAVQAADAINKNNYTIENPVGSRLNLTNATFNYRYEAQALEISGLGLQTDSQFKVTVTGVRDRAGNSIVNNGFSNVAQGKVLDANQTGGFIGGFDKPDFQANTDFGSFWENPQMCAPRSRLAGQSTSFECQFPTPASLASGSTLIITFPTGFDISAVSVPSSSQSFLNQDINGPGPGITTISGVATSTSSNTVTFTLSHSGDAMGGGDQLMFEFDGVVLPSSPGKKSLSIVVKDSNGVKQGQTINPAPFDVFQGGNLAISGTVCKGASSGGTCSGSDTGISGVKVFLDSMGGFGSGAIMGGHQEATTDSNGDFSFSGLSDGQYGLGLFMESSSFGDVGGGGSFMEVTLNGASKADVDFKLADLSTTGKTLTATVSGGPASEDIDLFCSAPGDFQFSAPLIKKITTDGSGAATTTLKVQPNTTYECGLGPHIPKENFISGGAPPVPDFSFLPPPPQTVVVGTSDVSISFALQTTSEQIKGKVVDGSGNGIANVFVDAFPAFGKGFDDSGNFKEIRGGFAKTKSDGTFVLKTVPGVYNVGACAPGMPCTDPVEVTVKANSSDADGNTTADVYKNGTLLTGAGLSLKMAKSSVTIAGQVQDENGNGIKYAFVDAQKIESGGTCTSFAPTGGFAGSPTDSSGNYTLYVSNGTWRVAGFAPAYGQVACKIITVSGGESKTGQNLKATAGDFGTVAGTVTKAGTAVQGASVTCFGPAGGNHKVTAADGSYSMKLKAGSGYSCEGFLQGAGPLTPVTGVTVSSGTTTTVDLSIGNPGTISIDLGTITDAFCDARDSSGRGDGTGQNSSGTYSLKVPPGTYNVRCGSPKYGQLVNQSVIVSAGGSQTVTGEAPTLYTITGRVTDGTNNLEGATVTFTDSTNGRIAFVQSNAATSTANNVSVQLPEGAYSVIASKAGYVDSSSAESLTVSANTSFTTRSLSKAAASVDVTVQSGGANYTGTARVIATDSNGKVVVADADRAVTSGANVSLGLTNGTWTVEAFGDNGKKSSASTVTVSGNSPNPSSLTLSLDTAITGFTFKQANQQSLVPKSGGLFKDTNIGSNFEVNIPASVLSTTDSTTGTLTTKLDPSLAVSTPGKKFVGDSAIDISVLDSSGKELKEFSSSGETVTVKIPYTESDVQAAGVTEANLTVGFWNEAAQEWETLSTTVDTDNNILIAKTDHFSSFGVIGPTGGGSSSSATAGGGGGDKVVYGSAGGVLLKGSSIEAKDIIATQATISWTTNVPADSQVIYAAEGQERSLDLADASGSPPFYGYPQASSVTDTGGTTTHSVILENLKPETKYFYRTVSTDGSDTTVSGEFSFTTLAVSEGPEGKTQQPSQPATKEPSAKEPAPSQEPAVSYNFSRDLELGMVGEDVKQLQQFLNQLGFTLAETGPGSPGSETSYFGPLTKAAVIAFQENFASEILEPLGLTTGTGYFGPSTREFINSNPWAGISPPSQMVSPEKELSAGFIGRDLEQGDSGPDVLKLQRFLNQQGFVLTKTGPGSPGNETSYFGPLTKAAVIAFQEAYAENILAPWDITQGTGFVGRTTRAQINDLLSQ